MSRVPETFHQIRAGWEEREFLARVLGSLAAGRPVVLTEEQQALCALLLDKAEADDLPALIQRIQARRGTLSQEKLSALTGYSRETISRSGAAPRNRRPRP